MVWIGRSLGSSFVFSFVTWKFVPHGCIQDHVSYCNVISPPTVTICSHTALNSLEATVSVKLPNDSPGRYITSDDYKA